MQTDRPAAATANVSASSAALWASAFVLGALIIAALGRGMGNEARADMVSEVEDYTILTFDSGNDEGVAIIDERTEDLLIYQIRNRQSLEFITRANLSQVFQEGQRIVEGLEQVLVVFDHLAAQVNAKPLLELHSS